MVPSLFKQVIIISIVIAMIFGSFIGYYFSQYQIQPIIQENINLKNENKYLRSNMTAGTDPNYVIVYRGKYFTWYAYKSTWEKYYSNYTSQLDYPDQVYDQLSREFNLDLIKNTTDHCLYLVINQNLGGGAATNYISEIGKGPGVLIAYDSWFNKYGVNDTWSTELIAHELVNVFTGTIAQGWPVDWWADHNSPFPYAIKIVTELELGHKEAAKISLNSASPLVKMFLNLRSVYGQNIFSKMLRMMKDDGWLQWFSPNPSKLLGEYVVAYLSLAAEEDLTTLINTNLQLEGIQYQLDPNIVQSIINRRQYLQSYPRNHSSWLDFREGRYLS